MNSNTKIKRSLEINLYAPWNINDKKNFLKEQ